MSAEDPFDSAEPPLRVLIADGDPTELRTQVRRMESLPGWRIRVDTCESGADFLQRLYAQPYDLVFLDMNLPDTPGVELLARLGRMSLPLPVVALSAREEARAAVEAMKHGALDHLMKEDFVALDLSGLLKRLLMTFRLKRENAELHQISQMKNDFLATISHELRTPLTSILGMSELLLAARMGPVTDKQSDSLKKIIEQSQNLSRLINQLLDVQDTLKDRPRVDARPLSLADTVTRQVEAARALFEKKGVRLTLAPPPENFRVKGDESGLGKGVEHLLLNALKFTPAGGHVEVGLHGLPSKSVLLSVQDSGQGIPKEALPFVFQKFFHADPTLTRSYGGLGLGLAYCQHVVESHGGRIWLESPGPNLGTTVNVTLTRVDGDAGGETFPAPVGRRSALWVDDNPNMLELVEVGFSSLGGDVDLVTCARGREALEEVERRGFHLIVLDIMMPDMNGLEVLSRLRANPRTRSIPILVVSGYREAAEEAMERGATAYFLKPFRVPEMLEKIRELLRLAKPARE